MFNTVRNKKNGGVATLHKRHIRKKVNITNKSVVLDNTLEYVTVEIKLKT